MVFVILSAFIGGALGILSAYHTKAFLSGLGSSLVIGFILLRPIVLLGASASAAAGRAHALSLYIEGFLMLPIGLQNAVLFFPIFIFAGRLAAWIYRCTTEPDAEQMSRERIAHTMEEFGTEHTWAEIIKEPEENPYAFTKLSAPKGRALFGARPKP